MVVETFLHGPRPVYEAVAECGRLLPEGLAYVDSWVHEDLNGCFQLMETDDPALLAAWIAEWSDLTRFEVIPVVTSAEASARALAAD
jgi:hypothetical protein